MKICRLTITTAVDGAENNFSCDAEMELTALTAKLRYRQENALVVISLENGSVFVERSGDYSLRLLLRQGEKTQGFIGIGGSEGEIGIATRKIGYSLQKNSLLLSMQYDLFMDGAPQKMKLRLFAKEKRGEV